MDLAPPNAVTTQLQCLCFSVAALLRACAVLDGSGDAAASDAGKLLILAELIREQRRRPPPEQTALQPRTLRAHATPQRAIA